MMLNTKQQTALNRIVEIATDGFEPASKIVLAGEGGTGKTYTLVRAIETIVEMGGRVLVCAPTHMARQGLYNKINPELARQGVDSRTTASLLGRFGYRTSGGDTAFSGGKIPAVSNYDLIVIDECSMLSQNDLNKLLLCNRPIVFTGDQKQLPVVKQRQASWADFETVTLTEQVRQHGAILSLAQKNRDSIYMPSPEDVNPAEGLHMVKTDKDLVDQMIRDIKKSDREVWEHRYLTYTNDEVFAINQFIHNEVMGTGAGPYAPGQYILLEQTCAAGYNSEIVQVTDVVDTAYNSNYDVTTYTVEIEEEHILYVVSPADRRKLNDFVAKNKERIKEAKKLKNTDAVNQFIREIEYVESNWTSVNYVYATTVHKAQGATIPRVYMNLDSMNKASNKRALLYVGISRASEQLWMNEVVLSKDKIVRRVNTDYKAARALYTDFFGYGKEHWRYRVNNSSLVNGKKVHMKCANLEDKAKITQGMLATVELVRTGLVLTSMKCADLIPNMIIHLCENITQDDK